MTVRETMIFKLILNGLTLAQAELTLDTLKARYPEMLDRWDEEVEDEDDFKGEVVVRRACTEGRRRVGST